MKLRMRFTNSGLMGAVLFVGSIGASGVLYMTMMSGLARGNFSGGIETKPFSYVVLSTVAALGFVMTLGGREIVSHDEIEQEHLEAASKRKP